jgi:hypothetical protein
VRDRFNVLAEKFGIELAALGPTIDELQSLAQLRNDLVHTVARFQYSAGGKPGSVVVRPVVGTVVSPDAAGKAINTVLLAIGALAESIGHKLFGRSPDLVFAIRRQVPVPERK